MPLRYSCFFYKNPNAWIRTKNYVLTCYRFRNPFHVHPPFGYFSSVTNRSEYPSPTMDLKLTGTVVQVLNEQTGQGKNGTWRKRNFILEIPGKFPKKVCVTQWGDNIDQHAVEEGLQVTAWVDIQSREYNGNWYTDVKAWKVEQGSGQQNAVSTQPPPPSTEGFEIDTTAFNDIDDELPF